MWFGERGAETKTEVCEEGHVQCFYVPIGKRCKGKGCPACGSSTLADCPRCGSPIGRRVGTGLFPSMWGRDLRPSRHCAGCGATLPWGTRRGRRAERLGAVRAPLRRHVKFRAAHAARLASGFTAGLADAMCVMAGRTTGTAASMRIMGNGEYRVTVGSSGHWAYTALVGSRWICDCPDFEGDAARCRHVWAAEAWERARPIARRLGVTAELGSAPKDRAARPAATGRIMKELAASPGRLEAKAPARIRAAWKRHLEWESRSNRDIELSADLADEDPEFAMQLAQQAVEKQIKAIKVYFAAFDDGFSPKSLRHDIFVSRRDKDFLAILDEHRLEIQKMTMGILTDPSKSGIVGHMAKTPSLVAYGPDIDWESSPARPETLTLENHYRYLQGSLRPVSYQPRELKCPMHEPVSHERWGRFDYGKGVETFAAQWEVDEGKMMHDFIAGRWKWKYYALYAHKDARYPSEFSQFYRQNVNIVKRWVFLAGFMTSSLQNRMRSCHARHTHREGDYLNRRMDPVRDHSWYENQIWLLTGDEDWRPDDDA